MFLGAGSGSSLPLAGCERHSRMRTRFEAADARKDDWEWRQCARPGALTGINRAVPSLILSDPSSIFCTLHPASAICHLLSAVLSLWSFMAITRNVRYRQLVESSRQLRSGRLTAGYMNKPSQSWCVRKSSPLSSPASKQSKNTSPAGPPRRSTLQDRLSCHDTGGWVAPTSAVREQGNVSNGTNTAGSYLMQPSYRNH